MAAHWFDDLAKKVAGTPPAQAEPGPRSTVALIPKVTDLCGRRKVGNTIVREVSQSDGDITFTQSLIFDPETQDAQSNTTVTKSGTAILTHQVSAAKSGSTTATTTYGADFQGVKNVSITSNNGISFQGTLDGRPFRITNTGPSSTAVFDDGALAPTIVADPLLTSTIMKLATEVSRSLTSCGATASALVGSMTAPGVSGAQAASTAAAPGSGKIITLDVIAAPGQNWYEPAGSDYVNCLNCEDGCNQTYANQVLSWECILSLGACVPYALAQWAGCMAICNLPGGGCLPVPCGTFTTCHAGDHCFSFQGGDLCCPAPAAVCNNVCCGKDIQACLPDGSCGCNSSEVPCENTCCSSGQICVEGHCCQPGQILVNGTCCNPEGKCGNVCCDEVSKCVDPNKGLCCSFAEVVCGQVCCPAGSACIDNTCCPHSQICGGVCCPQGHACLDPSTHQCAQCTVPGEVPCLPPEGAGLCCAPGADCCPGTCCPPGEFCEATVVNGKTTYWCEGLK